MPKNSHFWIFVDFLKNKTVLYNWKFGMESNKYQKVNRLSESVFFCIFLPRIPHTHLSQLEPGSGIQPGARLDSTHVGEDHTGGVWGAHVCQRLQCLRLPLSPPWQPAGPVPVHTGALP